LHCGKPKTAAIAAFLGESGLYRQKAADCCSIVTNFEAEAVFRRHADANTGPENAVFHKHRQSVHARMGIDRP
jgi:hypothetical protein